jgi:anti-sigma factor ChrR (cupin superfamily)
MQNILSAGGDLNTDLQQILVVQTNDMTWQKVADAEVWQKRLDCIKDSETGRQTSLLRFEAGAALPREKLSDRMEILVLDGTYRDGHGEYSAGTYLLNPPGFEHIPSSKTGCELYVQTRRILGAGQERLVVDTNKHEWMPRFTGKMIRLFEDNAVREEMHIGRMPAGQVGAKHDHPGGEEAFVLEGDLEDENSVYEKGTWLRFPGSFTHSATSRTGCLMYVREGDIG